MVGVKKRISPTDACCDKSKLTRFAGRKKSRSKTSEISQCLETVENTDNESDINQLYGRITEPMVSGITLNASCEDNYLMKTIETAMEIELQTFYGDLSPAKKDRKWGSVCCFFCTNRFSSTQDRELDQEKINKILVGIFLSWNDIYYDSLSPKVELLLKAKADINTTWGSGPFGESLLTRLLHSNHEKLALLILNSTDQTSWLPEDGKSVFLLASERYNYNIMKLMLEKESEPNCILESGKTPLISLCDHLTHKEEDSDYVEQLKCIKLLTTFEGPHARALKEKWVKIWVDASPVALDENWHIVADYCIPNINVRPAYMDMTAKDWLRSKNSRLFVKEGMALLSYLFKDAKTQKEKYWPADRGEYLRMFESTVVEKLL